MSFGWIDAERFSFNSLLLMDRWIFNTIAKNQHPEFRKHLAIALAGNPAVSWYVVNKCPNCSTSNISLFCYLLVHSSGLFTPQVQPPSLPR